MPIKLAEQDDRLGDVCRKAEDACAALRNTHEWPLTIVEDFRELPQVRLTRQATTPAAFIPSERRICINEGPFFAMTDDEQLAVLVHEVGHAVLDSADCFEADMFACEHGQERTLVAERRKHYSGTAGDESAAALLQWREPKAARLAFVRWRGRRLSGVI